MALPSAEELARRGAAIKPADRARKLQTRPTCAVCGRPVESFTEEEDDVIGEVIFVARCHGRREVQRAPGIVVGSCAVSFGLAFASEPRALAEKAGG